MGLWSLFGREGPSGFNSNSTAEEVTEGINATQLTAIVTGATSGIGKETARVLALRGAKVIIPARSVEGGLKVKESLIKENPNAKVEVMEMDLSSIKSVTSFAHSFKASKQPLNILINNAGIMACPYQLSVDGVELQFATNHLGILIIASTGMDAQRRPTTGDGQRSKRDGRRAIGDGKHASVSGHFLLTSLLLDNLKATAKESGLEGRIVNVSSIAHRYANSSWINLDNINDPSKYKPFGAYGKSKLANILHANELSRILEEEGNKVTANSLHPGMILTNISRYGSFKGSFQAIAVTLIKPFLKSIPQGASTTCYVALNPGIKGVTGKYFVNCNEANPSSPARNGDLGKKLWDFSQQLLNNLDRPK